MFQNVDAAVDSNSDQNQVQGGGEHSPPHVLCIRNGSGQDKIL